LEVLFLSLHRQGDDFFPKTDEPAFSGERHRPQESNNTVFKEGFGSKLFRVAMKGCVARIEEFKPDLIMISAGFT